ncbi:MAG: hypothetical protein ABI601_05805 [bacterium]
MMHAGSGVRLPRAERALTILSVHGGMLGTAAFANALECDGIVATGPALRALVAIGTLGIVRPIVWDEACDLWLDESRRRQSLDGSLDRSRRHFLADGRRALGSTGALSVTRLLDAAPLPPDQCLDLLFGSTRVLRVDDYIVADVQSESRLTRYARDMATVSPGIEIEDLAWGLWRVTPPLPRVPSAVVRRVLEGHPAFRLEGRAVFLVASSETSLRLSTADHLLIDALRERGGTMSFREVNALLTSRGVPLGYARRAAHAPWLVALPGGFGLRGHHGVRAFQGFPDVLSRARAEPQAKLLWANDDATVVRYRVAAASVPCALRFPNRLAQRVGATTEPWTVCTAPAHASTGAMTLGAERASLRDVRPWLVAVDARAGQHIELAVSIATQTLSLRLIPIAKAMADEAMWVALRPVNERRGCPGSPCRALNDGSPTRSGPSASKSE